jgi:uncharacterized membrane protein
MHLPHRTSRPATPASSHERTSPDETLHIPRPRALARHALPNLIEASIIPLAVYYGALWTVGVWGGLVAALVWSYTAVIRRVVARRPVPGLLLLGLVGITARTAMALASGSLFVYFLQPTLTTVLVGAVFLLSVPAGRPLAERLAGDFCPLPETFTGSAPVRRFFARITILWAFVQLANAAVSIWLLATQSIGTYVLARTVLSWALTGGAIVASTLYFKRSMRRHGITVHWRWLPDAA